VNGVCRCGSRVGESAGPDIAVISRFFESYNCPIADTCVRDSLVSKFVIIPIIFMISSFRLYDTEDTDRYLLFDTSPVATISPSFPLLPLLEFAGGSIETTAIEMSANPTTKQIFL
jgi:hypothetical protein